MARKKRRRIKIPMEIEDDLALKSPKKKRKLNPKKKKKRKKRTPTKKKKNFIPTALHYSRSDLNKKLKEETILLSKKAKQFKKERNKLSKYIETLKHYLESGKNINIAKEEIFRTLEKIETINKEFEETITSERNRIVTNLYSEERITQLIDYFFGTYTNEANFSLDMEEMGADVFVSKTFR